MKRLFSAKYSDNSVSIAMLVLRLGLGILMMNHGYQKMMNFSTYEAQFMSFLGIGKTMTLALVIFAEFFWSLFLILGLFTRLATIPLIITMCVALFKAHNAHFFSDGEMAAVYLTGYVSLFFIGPGKVSVDGLIGK